MTWLLAALAALAAVATWALVDGRWDLSMESAPAHDELAAARERARQTRLAQAALGQTPGQAVNLSPDRTESGRGMPHGSDEAEDR